MAKRGHWPKGKSRNAGAAAQQRRAQRALNALRKALKTTTVPSPTDLTRRRVAAALGVSDRTVRRWLSGEDWPPADKVQSIFRLVANPFSWQRMARKHDKQK